jgi:predicted metal-dependent phosphoesterase TrpH
MPKIKMPPHMRLKTNLHFHTADDPDHKIEYSLREAIDHAASVGFNVLALTCHNYFAWTKSYAEYAEEKGILLIPGAEMGIERGKVSKEGLHLLILGCHKDVENIQTFDDVREYKKKYPDVFVIAPHPFFPGNFSLKKELEKNIDIIDAIEESWFYSKWYNKNKKAKKIADKYKIPYISTSDTHFLDFMNQHFATLNTKEKTQKAIFEAIRNKDFKNTTKEHSFIKDMLIRQGLFTISDNIRQLKTKLQKRYSFKFKDQEV